MKKILIVVGSLRKNSFNLRLAREAAKLLDGKAEVAFLDYAALPLVNQDVEYPAPAEVARVREEVGKADGIWIFTPEYNFSYPGHLKNLIDWLSRPLKPGDFSGQTAIAGKKVCLSGVGGKAATAKCREKLVELLSFVRADVMTEPQVGIALGMDSFVSDAFELDDKQKVLLQAQAEAFLGFMNKE